MLVLWRRGLRNRAGRNDTVHARADTGQFPILHDYRGTRRTLTTVNFIDSSALTKLFVWEAGTEAMTRRLKSLTPEEKALSWITALEVRSAIRRRERSGDLSSANAGVAIGGLNYELAHLTLYPLSLQLLEDAGKLIDRCRLKALDSLQLASALQLANAPATRVIFLSCDKFLLEAAQAEGLELWNPEDHPAPVI